MTDPSMPVINPDVEVTTAAAHILSLIDNVQDQLATIRRTIETLTAQQGEVGDASQP